MKKYIFLALFVILLTSCADDGAKIDTVAPVDSDLSAAQAAADAAAQAAADAAAASAAEAAAAEAAVAAYCTATATFYEDADGDGFGSTTTKDFTACEFTTGYTDNSDDCDDTNADINPDARDAMGDSVDSNRDGEDLDCSRTKTFYTDADGDGDGNKHLGAPTQELSICTTSDELVAEGLSPNHTDCDDTDSTIHPGAADTVGDGIDTNCKTEQALRKYVVITDRGPAGGTKVAETYTFVNGKVVKLTKDLDGDRATDVIKHYNYDSATGDLLSIEATDVVATTYSKDYYSEFDTTTGNPVVKVHGEGLDAGTFANNASSTWAGYIYTYTPDGTSARVASLLTTDYNCVLGTDASGYRSTVELIDTALCTLGTSVTDTYTYTFDPEDPTVLTDKTVNLLNDATVEHTFTFEYNEHGDVALRCDTGGGSGLTTCTALKYTKGPAYALAHNGFKDSISLVRHQVRAKTEIVSDDSSGTEVVTAITHNLYDEEGSLVRSYVDDDHDGIGADDADHILEDSTIVVGIPTYVDNE